MFGGLCILAAVLGSHCSISGRVLDPQGRPVKFAVVNAVPAGFPVMAITTSGAETDGRGEYCLALPPGLYKVRGYARTRPPSASPSCKSCCRAATDFVPTFYPGQLNVEKGRTVSRIDIRLRRAQVYCVRGEVRDGSGALVKDAYLGLIMDDVGGSAGVITEAGRFLLTDLTPGAYTLTLMDRPQLGRIVARKAFRITNHGIRDLVITTPYGTASPPPRP